jgi:hypothetical protein
MKLTASSMLNGYTPVTITEYEEINPRVARVILTTSSTDKAAIAASLSSTLKNSAAAIPDSFRWLEYGNSMIGYVTASQDVRVLDKEASPIQAGYKLVAANIFMDNDDSQVWELKSGAAGKYLVRQGHDNLAELIEANRRSPRGSTPRMHSVKSAKAETNEVIAFVNSHGSMTPEVDYGMCVRTTARGYEVIVAGVQEPIEVLQSEVVSSHVLDTDELKQAIAAAYQTAGERPQKVRAATDDGKMSLEEYYRKLFSYNPAYVKLMMKVIKEQASM